MKPYVDILIDEVDRLREIIHNEGIYEYIQNEYFEQFRQRKDREWAKNLWMKGFICGGNYQSVDWVKTVLFPNLALFISHIGNRELSVALQRSEAYLLNNVIIRRISNELHDCILFSIYDSVLVDAGNSWSVQNIVDEESRKYFGFTAPLHRKDIESERTIDDVTHERDFCDLIIRDEHGFGEAFTGKRVSEITDLDKLINCFNLHQPYYHI